MFYSPHLYVYLFCQRPWKQQLLHLGQKVGGQVESVLEMVVFQWGGVGHTQGHAACPGHNVPIPNPYSCRHKCQKQIQVLVPVKLLVEISYKCKLLTHMSEQR